MPDSEGAAIVGYVCDALGAKRARFAGDDNAAVQAAMAAVNFDTMPHGWFIIVRKAPRPEP